MNDKGGVAAEPMAEQRETDALTPLKPVRCVESGTETCAYKQPGGMSAENEASLKRLVVALALSASFMLTEFVLGFFANSIALMTDAAHLLTDVGAFAIGILSIRLASYEGNEKRSFGLHRSQVLGSLAAVALNWVAVLVLAIEAIKRLANPPNKIDGKLIVVAASVGIGLNFLLLFVLGGEHGHHAHGHDHSHGHAHSDSHSHHHQHEEVQPDGNARRSRSGLQLLRYYTLLMCFGGEIGLDDGTGHSRNRSESDHVDRAEQDIEGGPSQPEQHAGHTEGSERKSWNINVRSAATHVLGDQVQSIGVVIAGALIWYKDAQDDGENWYFIDPVATFMFSILVIMTTIPLAKETCQTLMEEVPSQFQYSEIKMQLGEIEGVQDVHDLHIWSLSNGKPILTVHLDVKDDVQSTEVLHRAQDYCERTLGISHCTIQVEQQRLGHPEGHS